MPALEEQQCQVWWLLLSFVFSVFHAATLGYCLARCLHDPRPPRRNDFFSV